jgi:hypothetical protein
MRGEKEAAPSGIAHLGFVKLFDKTDVDQPP